MNNTELKLSYTRDVTAIIEVGWYDMLHGGLYKELGWDDGPEVAVFLYMNDGPIEIWESVEYLDWVKRKMYEEITKDEQLFFTYIDRWEKLENKLKEYWATDGTGSLDELKEFMELAHSGWLEFCMMYYPSCDDRMPKSVYEVACKFRNVDKFVDGNDTFITQSLNKIYPELKGYVTAILPEEVENPPSIDVLKARKKNFVFLGSGYNAIETKEEYVAKHSGISFLEAKVVEGATEIQGQIGNKGNVTGVVRVLRTKDKIAEAEEGDILVAPMTTPDFIPAMKKAAAFVTDEGGITCHAAIVAREMGKPCVIGTGMATKALKDGMEVEVDADSGVVKIL